MKKFSTFIKQNIRSFTMIFALIGIWIIFSILTMTPEGPVFLEARNISNIFRQMAEISFLAIGMVFVIVSGNIDLSVGSIVGVTGAIAAMIQVKWLGQHQFSSNVTSIIAISGALLAGILIGLFQGLWVAYGKVPSFIVTLGGLLILRGILLGITESITIAPMEPFFRSIGQSYIPKNGIPVPVVLLLLFVLLMSFIARNTTFGRYVYAIGGNSESARLSGINIKKHTLAVFVIMGLLAAVSGIVLTAKLDAATMGAGEGFELSAIAACVIGGTSLMGGKGTVIGAIIGGLVMASLDNGMSLMNVTIFWQKIIKGFVLILAVWTDIYTMSRKK